jgi:hypothetical protein
MGFRRSSSYPYHYIKNKVSGLVIWILWVDDFLSMGHKIEVSNYHVLMTCYFDCENIIDLKECMLDVKLRNRKEEIDC